jgi:hypothetical protein
MFNDEYGVRRPFAGIVENYDETRELYWVVYEDGDSEEMTHEEVLLFWSTNTNIQPTQSPTALSIPPSTTFFAVGSRVTIIPSHHTHGGKDGVVTRHTAKFFRYRTKWERNTHPTQIDLTTSSKNSKSRFNKFIGSPADTINNTCAR